MLISQFLTLTSATSGRPSEERVGIVFASKDGEIKTAKALDMCSQPPPFVEIDILSRCQHPFLVGCHTLTKKGEKGIEAQMPLFSDNLDNILEDATYRIHNRLRTASQIVSGVHALHTQLGVAHLDIKPSNILLATQLHARIGDFGHSVILGKFTKSLSTVGERGTPYFRPPEMDQKNPTVSFSCDIWALGITLLCILSRCRFPIPISNRSPDASSPSRKGLKPFEDNSPEAVILRTRHSLNLFISDVVHLRSELVKLLVKCPHADIAADLIANMLAIDPQQRPTIEQVATHPFWSCFDRATGIHIPFYPVQCRDYRDSSVYIPSLVRDSLELLAKNTIEEYPSLRATVSFRCLDLMVRSIQFRPIPDEVAIAKRYQACLAIAIGLDQEQVILDDVDWKEVVQIVIDAGGILHTPLIFDDMPFVHSLRALFGMLTTPKRFLEMTREEYTTMFRSSGTQVARNIDLLPR